MDSLLSYFLTTIIATVCLIVAYTKWSFTYWKRRNIPHLKGSLPLGNFGNPLTNRKPHFEYFREFYNEFKNMGVKGGGIYAFTSPIFISLHPEFNKNVLTKDFQYFHARGIYDNEKWQPVSANIFTVDGERWKNLRIKFTPTFTTTKIKSMFPLILECSRLMERHVDTLVARKTPLDIKNCVGHLTTDIIGSCAFGIECNSSENTEFHELLSAICSSATSFIRYTFCNALPNLARLLRISLLPTKETIIVGNLIEDTVERRKEDNAKRNDFMQLVIEMKDVGLINMNELKAQCILFLLAGYETSATTITFALFELARNQDVQERLRSEIKEILDKHHGEITYEAVMCMKYLEMVINETLRMYPPLPVLNRKCVQNYKFPNSNIAIEKGTNVVIPTIGLHYDPEYFPNPEKFDPERFSDENKHKIIPYTFMPFGEGHRSCLGERFGKQEVRVGLATLLRKYRLKLNPNVKLPLQLSTSFIPTPLQSILVDVETV